VKQKHNLYLATFQGKKIKNKKKTLGNLLIYTSVLGEVFTVVFDKKKYKKLYFFGQKT
jgi:hypothetical protein